MDRSSKPTTSPNQTARATERRIIALRFTHRWGPHHIGYHLHRSTVSKVLARCNMRSLGNDYLNTGPAVRKLKPVRYEQANLGDLVHVDVKKLGGIPAGGGRRILGDAGRRNKKKSFSSGCAFLHSAIDDHSRVV